MKKVTKTAYFQFYQIHGGGREKNVDCQAIYKNAPLCLRKTSICILCNNIMISKCLMKSLYRLRWDYLTGDSLNMTEAEKKNLKAFNWIRKHGTTMKQVTHHLINMHKYCLVGKSYEMVEV